MWNILKIVEKVVWVEKKNVIDVEAYASISTNAL